MQRVALINWENINQDYDLAKIIKSIVTSWIVEWLEVVDWKVVPWYAFVNITRDQETFPIIFINTEDLILDTTWTKKVYIEINQENIDDGSINNANWTWIWEIKIWSSYPSENYISLASINSWIITDERNFITTNDFFNITKQWNIFNWANQLVKLWTDWKISDLLLPVLNVSVPNVDASGVIPWETIKKMWYPANATSWNDTYTHEYNLVSWTIWQTFITPNTDYFLSWTFWINFWSYYNGHVKAFTFKIYDSISKTKTLYSFWAFDWNYINNTTTYFQLPNWLLKKNTEYYAELEVTNVYSTWYYVRVRYSNTWPYASWKMYINWAESVWNDMRFLLNYKTSSFISWWALFPARFWYKPWEETKKIYQYKKWDIWDVLWIVKSDTNWYSNFEVLEEWTAYDIYDVNLVWWIFTHNLDNIRKFTLKWLALWSWTLTLNIYNVLANKSIDLAWWVQATKNISFTNIPTTLWEFSIELDNNFNLTAWNDYAFILSCTTWNWSNKVTIYWNETVFTKSFSEPSNTWWTTEIEFINYQIESNSRTFNFTCNVDAYATWYLYCYINWVLVWSASWDWVKAITIPAKKWDILTVTKKTSDSNWMYVYTPVLTEIAPWMIYKSTTWANWLTNYIWRIFSRVESLQSIIPIKLITNWTIDLNEIITWWWKVFIDWYWNATSTEWENAYIWEWITNNKVLFQIQNIIWKNILNYWLTSVANSTVYSTTYFCTKKSLVTCMFNTINSSWYYTSFNFEVSKNWVNWTAIYSTSWSSQYGLVENCAFLAEKWDYVRISAYCNHSSYTRYWYMKIQS